MPLADPWPFVGDVTDCDRCAGGLVAACGVEFATDCFNTVDVDDCSGIMSSIFGGKIGSSGCRMEA